MRKGSKEAKAWGAKMRRLRGKPRTTKKRKKSKSTRKKRSTRKGQIRRTSRRAYTGLKRRRTKRKKSESAWSW